MKGWLEHFPFEKFNIFVITIVSLTYNVLLERDVLCSCKDERKDCLLYMFLPVGIIFFVMMWTDKTFLRVCRFNCTCQICGGNSGRNATQSYFCGLLFCCIFKALLVGLLWIISVLIDGDWYVCCWNDGSEQQSQLACKDTNITAEEKKIIIQLKNTSRVSDLFKLIFSNMLKRYSCHH